MVKYRLSRLAELDLENIWNYTAQEWSLNQAEKYLDGLFYCFDALADGNRKGRSIDSIRQGYWKTPYKKHHVYYRITSEKVIEIIRVLHVSMDIDHHL